MAGSATPALASVLAAELPAEQLADRLARLQALTSTLLRAGDPTAAAEAVLDEGLPALGAAEGWVCLLDPTGTTFEVVADIGATASTVEAWRSFPRVAGLPVSDALDRDDLVVWGSLAERDRHYPDMQDYEMSNEAYVIAPMIAAGSDLGAVVFGFEHARDIDTADRTFVRAAADQAAQAVRRAILLGEERRAHRWQRFLAESSLLLSRTLYSGDLVSDVAELAVPALADGCVVHLAENDGLRMVAGAHADPLLRRQLDALLARRPLTGNAYIRQVAATGESLLLGTVSDEMISRSTDDEAQRELAASFGVSSALCVALTARGDTLGTLTLLGSDADSPLGEDHLAIAEDLAARAALAIDNARLYERERRFAETLQRSMLPARFPETEGVVCASRYLPASEFRAIGGDWYAVAALEGGRVGLAVGDVAGHGPAAATAMGTMRNALRALATTSDSPAAVVAAFNRFVCAQMFDQMATLCYIVVDPVRGKVTYTNAGHPPPLLVSARQSTSYLDECLHPPVGVAEDITFEEVSRPLGEGSRIVLYTDGLVERRGAPIDDGLVELQRACADHRSGPEALCDHLIARLVGDEPLADDVAVLVAAVAQGGPG